MKQQTNVIGLATETYSFRPSHALGTYLGILLRRRHNYHRRGIRHLLMKSKEEGVMIRTKNADFFVTSENQRQIDVLLTTVSRAVVVGTTASCVA